MIKHIIALVVGSFAVILSMTYAQQGLQFMLNAHDWVAQALTEVFSVGNAGNLLRGFIALLTIPLLIGLIPAGIYWLIRRHWFPYFMQVVWVVWLIQAGALVMMYKTAI